VIRLSYPENVLSTPKEAGPATSATPAVNAAAGTAKRIEEDLAKDGRSIIYGIYFDFASDRIKEESEPVLSEIAQVLRTNPTWNLNVEGHTDSIGSDADNLDLSRRRSAAVKQALTTRYKIDLNRLQTSGYGESRPKDRNDTMEGRARNRRVELVKG
jgi:outer membrane protein OmpA-like peptidoglycan-associated protein